MWKRALSIALDKARIFAEVVPFMALCANMCNLMDVCVCSVFSSSVSNRDIRLFAWIAESIYCFSGEDYNFCGKI